MRKKVDARPEMLMFFILIAAVALANGLSDSIYANYFKEVYHINAIQRGFIEFPRELPGMLCALTIALLGCLGDLKVAFIAQALAFTGLFVLGVFTPSYSVMLIFLFINSMGMHLFMPLRDSIGMALAEPDQVGRRMGQLFSVNSAFILVASLLVFSGFRVGFFSFATPVKTVFLVGATFFLFALVITLVMIFKVKLYPPRRRQVRFIFRKQYRYYYMVTVLKAFRNRLRSCTARG